MWDWSFKNNTNNAGPQLWFKSGSLLSVLKHILFPRGTEMHEKNDKKTDASTVIGGAELWLVQTV